MKDCTFCKLIQDKSNLIWENDTIAAFNDIKPSAPIHILIVPKTHIAKLDDLEDQTLSANLLKAVKQIAQQVDLRNGYRVIINNGPDSGQIVEHLHLHLLGGKKLST